MAKSNKARSEQPGARTSRPPAAPRWTGQHAGETPALHAGPRVVQTGAKARLIEAALAARLQAVAPYSHFPVGAALLTTDGEIITGANVESVSYGLTCCAERVALFKALTDGKNKFRAVAVVAAHPGGPTPCGACRQLLAEYAPDAVIWIADAAHPKKIRQFTVRELLPAAFSSF